MPVPVTLAFWFTPMPLPILPKQRLKKRAGISCLNRFDLNLMAIQVTQELPSDYAVALGC